jgi:SAM-dependent MidA family methyltransferase
LRGELERFRVISFARFMELALYCPEFGFYERDQCRIGRQGDFYTSVSVGRLFGELLAFQFAEWIESSSPQAFRLIEAGAHDGQLASDILTWFRDQRSELFGAMEYTVVEPSPRRQAWQRSRLDKFAGQVRWLKALDDLAAKDGSGVIFSNELLDAFPVHVLRWDALERCWREWGVALRGGQFAWERMATRVSSWKPALKLAGLDISTPLATHLPDGFTVEFSPAAAQWWRKASSLLRQGKLLTIDYGGDIEELLSPARSNGTLRAYARHHPVEDLLANPGSQDLTAHVNFTQLRNTGEDAGLKTEASLSQAEFLGRIMAATLSGTGGFPHWTPARSRQFQTLTHPEHLGRRFRVLIQSRAH